MKYWKSIQNKVKKEQLYQGLSLQNFSILRTEKEDLKRFQGRA